MRRLPAALAYLLAAGLAVSVAAGFLGPLHPAFDTLSSFRWHLAILSAAVGFVLLLSGFGKAALLAGLVAVSGAWQSLDGLPLSRDGAGTVPDRSHTLLAFNKRFDNPRRDGVIGLIRETDADIVMLTEYSRLWEDALKRLHGSYPHRFHCGEWLNFGGSMIFSRFPMKPGTSFCGEYASLATVEMEIDGVPLVIGMAHLRWPWPASGPRQIDALQPVLARIGRDALIAGDFNSVTWSHGLRRFASGADMDIRGGIGGTFMPAFLPSGLAPWLGLPIDNVLHKGAVRIDRVDTLDATGSDHLPLLVRFSIEQQP